MSYIFLILSYLITVSQHFSNDQELSSHSLDWYVEQNDKETRLSDFRDSNEALRIKLLQVDLINNSRRKHNAGPVQLDILASRVANKMSKEAAENNFTGHWNMNGEKPYQRYALAGGHDHISENSYGEWSSDHYDTSLSNTGILMKNGHESFMSERPPYDGHKKTITDKFHNYVGIGFHLAGNQFRYYEEYIDRYLDFSNIPAQLNIGQSATITVKTDGTYFLYYLIIYREKFPEPMTVARIRREGSYNDYGNQKYMETVAWDLAQYRKYNTYEIPVSFSAEGLYYINIYIDSKEITKPTSLNTKGKIQASGIVIRVQNPTE